MKRFYKIIRTIAVILLALMFTVPATLYVALSLPSVQRSICRRTSAELSRLLNSRVDVDHIAISPFNRVTLLGVTVFDAKADTALNVERLGTGVSIRHLFRKELVFNYAELIGMDMRLKRDSIGAPLNIQPIIDALSPKEKNKPPTKFNFRISTVIIRTSSVSYDVVSAPATPGHFNPQHIHVKDLRADLSLPEIANNDFNADVRRLAFSEQSGVEVKRMKCKVRYDGGNLDVNNLSLELPGSRITLNDQHIPLKRLQTDKEFFKKMPVDIRISDNSRLSTADIVPFLPQLKDLNLDLEIAAAISGTPSALSIERLILNHADRLTVDVSGYVEGATDKKAETKLEFPEVDIECTGAEVADIIGRFTTLAHVPATILKNMGHTRLTGEFSGTPSGGDLDASVVCDAGTVEADAFIGMTKGKGTTLKGKASVNKFNGARLMAGTGNALQQLGTLTASSDFNMTLHRNRPQGNVSVKVDEMIYRGARYTDITADADIEGYIYTGAVNVENPGVALNLTARLDMNPEFKTLDFNIDATHINLEALNLASNTRGRTLSLSGEGTVNGQDIDHINGSLYFRDIAFVNHEGSGPRMDNLSLVVTSSDRSNSLRLRSDALEGDISGHYRVSRIPVLLKEIASNVFPMLIPAEENKLKNGNVNNSFDDQLHFNFRLKNLEALEQITTLPVKVIHPVDISGAIDGTDRKVWMKIDAPYLLKGKSVIENTSLTMGMNSGRDGENGDANLYATTLMPTKNGPMTMSLSSFATGGQLDTQIGWNVNSQKRYSGNINFSTHFERTDENALRTLVDMNPGNMVINDTVWEIAPSKIEVDAGRVFVDKFRVGRTGQYVAINGTASKSPDDELIVSLEDMNLDYVFETLGIETAMFGGNATGKIYVSSAFTPQPKLYTPLLEVKGMKYNHTLLGDAKITSRWIPETKTIKFDADVTQSEGYVSKIDGRIMPMSDSLDIYFDAKRIPIGFLQPFMQAFATNVSGYASGKARLWGSFKLVDMVGDVYGEDVSITLGFTNTTYTTTDSIYLRPGRIDIDNITIHDKFGNKALLNGYLTHHFFKEPSFEFNVTQAHNLLVYDVKKSSDLRWYGTVFGNGQASVKGSPGIVNIGVNVSTAPNSKFTFVLSDAQEASQFNFITFRDRNQAKKNLDEIDLSTPPLVQQYKRNNGSGANDEAGSIYRMDIAVDVNPNAQVTMVMDPVGGDEIVARGAGNMRMTYNSVNEDLKMFGKYTLDQGKYTFTFQDIIIKDFIIREGSSITFNGNPYAAQLAIKAAYATNANLSDLDESFLQDKDLNRTNVPVHAMLLVSGDMRAPDISFDLEFPTLTSQDTYRKVKSIINTDEMMNRQIIYLLTLNRFYTPDYMTATRGNELVSVASSTLSSQLTNMLGQLSDKWSISPNFRSDRGDFSDLEVDLALSSHLLNNRLLLNGNFGYRDKTLNNNTFIGDFDIEYLLNRTGTIRLKAYNRYNDQNYYVKSALTTQGVGVVFKRDFDNMFSFLRPWLRKKSKKTEATDSVRNATNPSDSVPSGK